VCHLILTDRNTHRPVEKDVGTLQQRIAEKAISREIAILELLLLILVGRHALEPAERRDHRQQQVQLRVLRHTRLDEHGRDRRVQTGREPVDDDGPGVFDNFARVFVTRRERVHVGDEEIAVVLILQLDPVLQRAMEVPEMQGPRRTHS
jgi:hypothetical protein